MSRQNWVKELLLSPRGLYLLNWKVKEEKNFLGHLIQPLIPSLVYEEEGLQARAAGQVGFPLGHPTPLNSLPPTHVVTFKRLRCPVTGFQGYIAVSSCF